MASGPPNESGRLVTRMKIGPLCFSVFSLAASEAEVLEAGYSPPVPKPTTPRAMVNIQNMPIVVLPLAADTTKNDHQGGENDGNFTSEVVAGQSNGELPNDLANQQGIRDASRVFGCVDSGVFLLEYHVGHGPGEQVR